MRNPVARFDLAAPLDRKRGAGKAVRGGLSRESSSGLVRSGGRWRYKGDFHLVGSIEPKESIHASESVGDDRWAFKPVFSSDNRKKFLKDAIESKDLLYLCALSGERSEHYNG